MLDALVLLLGPAVSPADDDRAARLQAEADSLPALTADMINALVEAAEGHDAALTSVILDGFRAIEGGYRAWATATISPAARQAPAVRIVDGPMVAEADGAWRISATVVIE
jgi:hypothetical protein